MSNIIHIDFKKKEIVKKKKEEKDKKLSFNNFDQLMKQADKAKW